MTLLSIQSIDSLEKVRSYEIMPVFRRLRAQGVKLLQHMVDAYQIDVLVVGVAPLGT